MIIFLTALAAILSVIGALWALNRKSVDKKFIGKILAFSSGIMIALAFMHLLPEGYELGSQSAFFGVFFCIALFFTIENFTIMNSCSEFVEDCHMHHMSSFAFVALTLHSLMDGFNVPVAFSVKESVGFNALAAVFAHKFADGVTLASIMIAAGSSKKKVMKASSLMALATPVGALLSQYFINYFSSFTPFLLGVSAGSFIYISMTEIIPHLHKEKNRLAPVMFLAGCAFVFIIHNFSGHH